MSPRSSCPDTELQRQCYVALYDYNPYQSCTTGRPELELPFKKGDIMTVIGEMDVNGYYKAEMDGRLGSLCFFVFNLIYLLIMLYRLLR